MPWKETSAMDERVKFIADWLSGDYGKSELCAVYGISRPTGYKWIKRYVEEGASGVCERSRAPIRHPNATDGEKRRRIIATKQEHPKWGPKKVIDLLRREEPKVRWPADSTAGEILRRAGLVQPRRRKRRVSPYSEPFGECYEPNQVWSADFKGDFALGNGRRCYPLTISDNFSRYLLVCRGLYRPSFAAVRPWFEKVFRDQGLPEAIRTDNGPPFASLALGGISQLSRWWIRLGIRPERIKPATPSQNGRHERMHRTLKETAVVPVHKTVEAQQSQFDAFIEEYNWLRSHEALGRETPGSFYRPSARPYPEKLPEVEYGPGTVVRRVRHSGEIKWSGHRIYLCQTLAKEPVGLRPIGHDQWEVRYSFHPLGILDEQTLKITPHKHWHHQKPDPQESSDD